MLTIPGFTECLLLRHPPNSLKERFCAYVFLPDDLSYHQTYRAKVNRDRRPTSEIPLRCWRRYRTVQAIRRGFLRWRKSDSDFPFWKRKILLSPRMYSLPYSTKEYDVSICDNSMKRTPQSSPRENSLKRPRICVENEEHRRYSDVDDIVMVSYR